MLEIVLGALILGISGVVVIELVRSNTANLELTEIEAVARGLAADLVERFSRPSSQEANGVSATTQVVVGQNAKWDTLLSDPSFAFGFPKDKLSKILDEYDVHFEVDLKKFPHASFGDKNEMTQVSVVVKWLDLGPNAGRNPSGEYKSVNYGCLIDR